MESSLRTDPKTHFAGIRYHAEEALASLQEMGEIVDVKERAPFDPNETLQYDRADRQLESVYRFAITIITATRDWAVLTGLALDRTVLIEPPAPAEPSQHQGCLSPILNLLSKIFPRSEHPKKMIEAVPEPHHLIVATRLLQQTWKGHAEMPPSLSIRARLEKILGYLAEAKSEEGNASSSGNTFEAVEKTFRDAVGIIGKNLETIPEQDLSQVLEKERGKGIGKAILARIHRIVWQLKLWNLQERSLEMKGLLFQQLSDFGQFNPDRGIFEDILHELFSDDHLPEKPPTTNAFRERLMQLKMTIVNQRQLDDIFATFKALAKCHYYGVAFKLGVTPDRVDPGMIFE